MTPPQPARALLDQWAASFTGKDLDAARSVFTSGEDLLVITASDTELPGPAAVSAYLDGYMAGPVTYSWSWGSVWTAQPDQATAWLAAKGTETRQSPQGLRTRPYRVTLIARRESPDWKIVHFHGSSTPPPGPPRS